MPPVMNVDDLIKKGQQKLDKTSATLLASSDDPQRRRFIGEALLGAVFVFLLHRYCEGFLKGAGFDELAEKHGRLAVQWWKNIHSETFIQLHLSEAEQKQIGASISKIRQTRKSDAARMGRESVASPLRDAGAVSGQARDVAELVEGLVKNA